MIPFIDYIKHVNYVIHVIIHQWMITRVIHVIHWMNVYIMYNMIYIMYTSSYIECMMHGYSIVVLIIDSRFWSENHGNPGFWGFIHTKQGKSVFWVSKPFKTPKNRDFREKTMKKCWKPWKTMKKCWKRAKSIEIMPNPWKSYEIHHENLKKTGFRWRPKIPPKSPPTKACRQCKMGHVFCTLFFPGPHFLGRTPPFGGG